MNDDSHEDAHFPVVAKVVQNFGHARLQSKALGNLGLSLGGCRAVVICLTNHPHSERVNLGDSGVFETKVLPVCVLEFAVAHLKPKRKDIIHTGHHHKMNTYMAAANM